MHQSPSFTGAMPSSSPSSYSGGGTSNNITTPMRSPSHAHSLALPTSNTPPPSSLSSLLIDPSGVYSLSGVSLPAKSPTHGGVPSTGFPPLALYQAQQQQLQQQYSLASLMQSIPPPGMHAIETQPSYPPSYPNRSIYEQHHNISPRPPHSPSKGSTMLLALHTQQIGKAKSPDAPEQKEEKQQRRTLTSSASASFSQSMPRPPHSQATTNAYARKVVMKGGKQHRTPTSGGRSASHDADASGMSSTFPIIWNPPPAQPVISPALRIYQTYCGTSVSQPTTSVAAERKPFVFMPPLHELQLSQSSTGLSTSASVASLRSRPVNKFIVQEGGEQEEEAAVQEPTEQQNQPDATEDNDAAFDLDPLEDEEEKEKEKEREKEEAEAKRKAEEEAAAAAAEAEKKRVTEAEEKKLAEEKAAQEAKKLADEKARVEKEAMEAEEKKRAAEAEVKDPAAKFDNEWAKEWATKEEEAKKQLTTVYLSTPSVKGLVVSQPHAPIVKGSKQSPSPPVLTPQQQLDAILKTCQGSAKLAVWILENWTMENEKIKQKQEQAKGSKDSKDNTDSKDNKNNNDGKDSKESKDSKEKNDSKDNQDITLTPLRHEFSTFVLLDQALKKEFDSIRFEQEALRVYLLGSASAIPPRAAVFQCDHTRSRIKIQPHIDAVWLQGGARIALENIKLMCQQKAATSSSSFIATPVTATPAASATFIDFPTFLKDLTEHAGAAEIERAADLLKPPPVVDSTPAAAAAASSPPATKKSKRVSLNNLPPDMRQALLTAAGGEPNAADASTSTSSNAVAILNHMQLLGHLDSSLTQAQLVESVTKFKESLAAFQSTAQSNPPTGNLVIDVPPKLVVYRDQLIASIADIRSKFEGINELMRTSVPKGCTQLSDMVEKLTVKIPDVEAARKPRIDSLPPGKSDRRLAVAGSQFLTIIQSLIRTIPSVSGDVLRLFTLVQPVYTLFRTLYTQYATYYYYLTPYCTPQLHPFVSHQLHLTLSDSLTCLTQIQEVSDTLIDLHAQLDRVMSFQLRSCLSASSTLISELVSSQDPATIAQLAPLKGHLTHFAAHLTTLTPFLTSHASRNEQSAQFLCQLDIFFDKQLKALLPTIFFVTLTGPRSAISSTPTTAAAAVPVVEKVVSPSTPAASSSTPLEQVAPVTAPVIAPMTTSTPPASSPTPAAAAPVTTLAASNAKVK